MAGQDPESWRVSLDYSISTGLSGGHPETEGVTPDGRVISVHPHAHNVEMDITRYELGLTRTFDENWDAVLRVPYFIKDQTALTTHTGALTPEERDAALHGAQIHHRTATYRGFADLELSLGWRKHGLIWENSIFRCSFGLTLPTGATESDPLVAGDRGLEHLHIQFGNGTVDPVFDVYLGLPLAKKWAFSLYGKARLPLYENSHGYQGSTEAMLLPRVTWLPTKAWSFSAGLSASYFGYSEWNGRRDPNSGQLAMNAAFGLGWKVNEHFTTSLNALLPVYTKSFAGEDTLVPAPTLSCSLGWTF